MANLTGFNIGANQRGILNIGSVINTPLDTTLRAVTDGDGNASPLQLSTTAAQISGNLTVTGTSTLSAINAYIGNPKIRFSRLFLTTTNVDNSSETEINTVSRTWSDRVDWSKVFLGTFTLSGVAAGTPTNTARLHVRGDGTNPIARFENSAGTNQLSILNDGTLQTKNIWVGGSVVGGSNQQIVGENHFTFNNYRQVGGFPAYVFNSFGNVFTSGTNPFVTITGDSITVVGSGSPIYRPLNIAYTINNTGAANTGTATGIFLNATETALNGMTHNLMDLQVGGVSRFRVGNAGNIICGGINSVSSINCSTGGAIFWELRSFMRSPADGLIRLSNYAETDFNRLQFGGTTNAFPALKRNGAALEVRLADDSGFADIYVKGLFAFTTTTGFTTAQQLRTPNSNFSMYGNGQSILWDSTNSGDTNITSSLLTMNSTTRGFLPPRMTTAQRDLIGTPAAGLMIYNTTTNRPNFFDGTVWVAL